MGIIDGSWRVLDTEMPVEVIGFRCAAYDNKLYCIGDVNTHGNILQIYDIGTNEWLQGTPLPMDRGDNPCPCIQEFDAKLFVYSIDGNFYIYDIAKDSWTLGASPPERPTYSASCVHDGVFYLFGGWSGTISNKVYAYNPDTDTWSEKSSMHIARQQHSAIVLNNKIYCVGGLINGQSTALNSLEIYDPISDQWSIGSPMQESKCILGVGTFNNLLLCFGGALQSAGYTNKTEVYNPSTNTWSEGPPLSSPKGYIGYTTHNNMTYCVGGQSNENGLTIIRNIEAFSSLPSESHPITEQYHTQSGTPLQPDTTTNVPVGETYTKAAPTIEGYTCIGYKVDGSELQSGTTVTIEDVQEAHTVTFIYKEGDEPGPEPGDKCKCEGGYLKMELKLPICNNTEMLSELGNLIDKAKSCDCSCK